MALEPPQPRAFAPPWAAAGVAGALLIAVLVLVAVQWQREEQEAALRRDAHGDKSVSVGDSAVIPLIATPVPEPQGGKAPTLGRPLPEKPFPGQRQPPCTPRVETVLRGACWVGVIDMKPPCGNNAFDWEGKCYIPALNPARQPTSNTPP
jgi:hypothetical protein